MIRTQISLTEDQQAALQRLATLRQVSQAAVLRDALEQLLRDEQRQRHADAVLRMLGAFDSGATAPIDYDAEFVDSIS